ncbi:MAG TPA: heavy metal-binding domain-containing protein [bacterium]|nr:heavy metal-binding domain-containing protein [bacterium]
MKRILSWTVLGVWMSVGQAVLADNSMGNMTGMSTPAMSATPAMKHKIKMKRTKKKTAKVAKVYACPMDGYTSNKPGKCPQCGMDLMEKQ